MRPRQPRLLLLLAAQLLAAQLLAGQLPVSQLWLRRAAAQEAPGSGLRLRIHTDTPQVRYGQAPSIRFEVRNEGAAPAVFPLAAEAFPVSAAWEVERVDAQPALRLTGWGGGGCGMTAPVKSSDIVRLAAGERRTLSDLGWGAPDAAGYLYQPGRYRVRLRYEVGAEVSEGLRERWRAVVAETLRSNAVEVEVGAAPPLVVERSRAAEGLRRGALGRVGLAPGPSRRGPRELGGGRGLGRGRGAHAALLPRRRAGAR